LNISNNTPACWREIRVQSPEPTNGPQLIPILGFSVRAFRSAGQWRRHARAYAARRSPRPAASGCTRESKAVGRGNVSDLIRY